MILHDTLSYSAQWLDYVDFLIDFKATEAQECGRARNKMLRSKIERRITLKYFSNRGSVKKKLSLFGGRQVNLFAKKSYTKQSQHISVSRKATKIHQEMQHLRPTLLKRKGVNLHRNND